jgi:5'-methylthioadenosine phosphorylase
MKSKPKIAIIGGSGVYDPKIFKKVREVKIKTPFGLPSSLIEIGDFSGRRIAFLARHGKKKDIPPHKVNYRANIFALEKLGVKDIFAFNSAASLKKDIRSGSFLISSDYIDLDPPTFFDRKLEFITPQISDKLRRVLIKIMKRLKLRFRSKGVYFNSKGPRLETKAEINLMKKFADVVGMTMAKEATLAQELGLEYAALCSIDNYAHGIVKKALSQEEIFRNQRENSKILEKIMTEILKFSI